MRIVRTAQAMQRQAKKWNRDGVRTGFVPTMGFLHDGHLSLVRRARKAVGPAGKVVLSIYVNPTQFGPQEDLASYPRDLPGDARLCKEAGVDLLFAPSDEEMYPGAAKDAASTFVVEESLSRHLEGISRPIHFRGVTTVVASLFNLVLPDAAVFGAKDYQQAAIVRRMARDLHFPVKVIVHPTRREPDGLAMSSRNKYLNPDERRQAAVLSAALTEARRAVRSASPSQALPVSGLRARLERLIRAQPSARVDYVAFFDPDTLEPVKMATPGTHLALAVFIGKTRLIDNARL